MYTYIYIYIGRKPCCGRFAFDRKSGKLKCGTLAVSDHDRTQRNLGYGKSERKVLGRFQKKPAETRINGFGHILLFPLRHPGRV